MRTIISIFIFIFFASTTLGQSYEWNLEKTFSKKNIRAWDITPLGEVILFEQGTLHKLDTNFQVLFTQSKNVFGTITKIDARHSLKTLLFSDNQQVVGFVDNALSFQDGKIDLGLLNIGYATQVCYSDQTNRFWVFDEQNARLVLFEGIKSSVAQSEISNLMSITYDDMPTSMVESQSQLFLFYQGSGVFLFDYYGSLLRKYEYSDAVQVYPTEKYLYVLKKKEIVRLNRKSGNEESIPLPKKEIEDIRVFGRSVFFKDKDGVSRYSLIPN